MDKKIGIVVQRYGLEINGGAEYHARLIAENLSKHKAVEVFTSTALDYLTWSNHFNPGREEINGIIINRFNVSKQRDPGKFGMIQRKVFEEEHTIDDEKEWLIEQGPYVPELIEELSSRQDEFEKYIFFSYRYFHSYEGIRNFGDKAILVPTAEHDEVIYMRIFKEIFTLPFAIIYNSHEEKELINRVAGNREIKGDIVGVGSEIPARYEPQCFKEEYGLKNDYILYVGRLDENKGVPELLDYFIRFKDSVSSDIELVLIGKSVIDIPDHGAVKHLGFLSDTDKFNALAGSVCLVIPSQYESLSMVTLEAWAAGIPVMANGRTDVLKGQCMRSNAGLWFSNYSEFRDVLALLLGNDLLRDQLGKNGMKFFKDNYSWEVIEKKYLDILNTN